MKITLEYETDEERHVAETQQTTVYTVASLNLVLRIVQFLRRIVEKDGSQSN